jgi:hypothetical protein
MSAIEDIVRDEARRGVEEALAPVMRRLVRP